MIGRLRERAGLESASWEATPATAGMWVGREGREKGRGKRGGFGDDDGGAGGGVIDDPVALLVGVASLVGGVLDDPSGGGDGRGGSGGCGDDGGVGEGEEAESAVACLVLEEGLAAVAYSVMDSACFLGRKAARGAPAAMAVDANAKVAMATATAVAGSPGTVDGCDDYTSGKEEGEEEGKEVETEFERALLERAERSFDRFCEKVSLPPALRLQVRLSWLLDNRDTIRGAVAAAAAALLCPRAAAFLAEDPELLWRAGMAIADGGSKSGGGAGVVEGGSPPGRGWGAFVPLAEEMMSAAIRAGGGGSRAWGEEDGARALVGGGSGKRQREAPSPCRGLQSPRRDLVQPGGVRAGPGSGSRHRSGNDSGGAGGVSVSVVVGGGFGGGSSGSSNRDLAHKGWGRQQEQAASTPPFLGGVNSGDGEEKEVAWLRTPSARKRESFRSGGDGDGRGESDGRCRGGVGGWGGDRSRGGWEEENEEQQEEEHPGGVSFAKRPRARGRTLWQTPRGVGLTPKGRDASRDSPLSADFRDVDGSGSGGGERWGGWRGAGQPNTLAISGASHARRPRTRGQTLWETPRGVGLTPKRAGAPAGEAQLSVSCYDRGGGDGIVGGNQEEHREDERVDCVSSLRRTRARGKMLCKTPRGVGLTPKRVEARTGVSPSARYGGDGGGQFGWGKKQGDGYLDDACSAKKGRTRGQTLWQTPRGVGLTPNMANGRTEEPLSVRYHADGGDEYVMENVQHEEDDSVSALSAGKPRARRQTLWQTPRGVGLTPKMAGVRTWTLDSDHDRDGDGGSVGEGREEQRECNYGSSASVEKPRARGQTMWQTTRDVSLAPKREDVRTGTSLSAQCLNDGVSLAPKREDVRTGTSLSARCLNDGDDDGEGDDEGQQEGEHAGNASSVKRPHARGKTLWQTPRGAGLTPKMAGARAKEPLSVRCRGDGDGAYGVEVQREEDCSGSALSAERPRVRGQTLWQTPRGVGLTPIITGGRAEAIYSDHFGDDGVEGGCERQQGEEGSGNAFSFERPRARGQTLWQTPRGVGLTPNLVRARTRAPLSDRYHDNAGDGDEYSVGQQQEEQPGNAFSLRRPRARGQTVWQTPRGVGLTPKSAGARRESLPSFQFCDASANDNGVGGYLLGQQDEDLVDNVSSDKRPRARGQTVWQTPRGVGLTPKERGGDPYAGEQFLSTTDHVGGGCSGSIVAEVDPGGFDSSGVASPGQAPRGRGLFPARSRLD